MRNYCPARIECPPPKRVPILAKNWIRKGWKGIRFRCLGVNSTESKTFVLFLTN